MEGTSSTSMNIYGDTQSSFCLGKMGFPVSIVKLLEGSCSCLPLFLIKKMGIGHYFGGGMSLNSRKLFWNKANLSFISCCLIFIESS